MGGHGGEGVDASGAGGLLSTAVCRGQTSSGWSVSGGHGGTTAQAVDRRRIERGHHA